MGRSGVPEFFTSTDSLYVPAPMVTTSPAWASCAARLMVRSGAVASALAASSPVGATYHVRPPAAGERREYETAAKPRGRTPCITVAKADASSTVTATVAMVPLYVAAMVTDPGASAVTSPAWLTCATAGRFVAHCNLPGAGLIILPPGSTTVAVTVALPPTGIVRLAGLTTIR